MKKHITFMTHPTEIKQLRIVELQDKLEKVNRIPALRTTYFSLLSQALGLVGDQSHKPLIIALDPKDVTLGYVLDTKGHDCMGLCFPSVDNGYNVTLYRDNTFFLPTDESNTNTLCEAGRANEMSRGLIPIVLAIATYNSLKKFFASKSEIYWNHPAVLYSELRLLAYMNDMLNKENLSIFPSENHCLGPINWRFMMPKCDIDSDLGVWNIFEWCNIRHSSNTDNPTFEISFVPMYDKSNPFTCNVTPQNILLDYNDCNRFEASISPILSAMQSSLLFSIGIIIGSHLHNRLGTGSEEGRSYMQIVGYDKLRKPFTGQNSSYSPVVQQDTPYSFLEKYLTILGTQENLSACGIKINANKSGFQVHGLTPSPIKDFSPSSML